MKRVEARIGFSKLAELREMDPNLWQELKNDENIVNNLFCVLFKFIKRDDGKFIYTFANGKLSKQNRLNGFSLVGHSVEEMFPQDTALILNRNYELAYEGELVTFKLYFKDHYYFTVLSPIMDEGKTIEVIGTAIDITAQKTKKSEKGKFTAIFNEVQDAIIFFDDMGLPIEVNQAASELFGVSIEDFKQSSYPADLKKHLNRSLEKLNTDGSMKEETVLKRMDGRDLHVDFSAKANIAQGVHLAILRDITGKKELEESLRKSETLQVVGELAAGIGHEIRNPITAIKGFIQLLKEEPGNLDYHDVILNEFDRIDKIISEFMILSKPQAHHFSREEISTIMNSTITLMAPQANLRNVSLRILIEENLPSILCEKNQLKQVFINLIKNGIECMESGGNLWVMIKSGNADSLTIAIKDEGCGIPPDIIERLGEPFYTSKSNGTGLGLMVSYRIIQNHKGTIKVESELGKGTTFMIKLPFNQ